MHVQLEPELLLWVDAGGGEFFDRVGGVGGHGLDDACEAGAAGEVDFAVGVAEFCEGGGGDEDGGGRGETEEGGGGVAFGDVDEYTRTEEDLTERFCVFVFGWG